DPTQVLGLHSRTGAVPGNGTRVEFPESATRRADSRDLSTPPQALPTPPRENRAWRGPRLRSFVVGRDDRLSRFERAMHIRDQKSGKHEGFSGNLNAHFVVEAVRPDFAKAEILSEAPPSAQWKYLWLCFSDTP